MTRWHFRGGSILCPGVTVTLLLLLAVSCESSAPAASSYGYGPLPPAVTSDHLRPTVEAMEVERYAQAIQAERAKDAAEATLAVFWAQETAQVQKQNATATAQAQATAVAATASAQAILLTQQAADRTATATAAIWQQTATATAHAPTATAEKALFDLSVQQTQETWSITRQAQESALHAQQTAQSAAAEQARLEAERARLVYPVRAYGPWVLFFAAFAVLLWAGVRFARALEIRARTIKDASGDVRFLVLPGPHNGQAVVIPPRSLGPVITIDSQEVSQPQLAPPELQERVTSRQQAVEALKAIDSAPNRRRAARALTRMMTRNQPPVIRIVPPEALRPVLRELRTQALIRSAEEGGEG